MRAPAIAALVEGEASRDADYREPRGRLAMLEIREARARRQRLACLQGRGYTVN
jgi:hypothetical protein